MKTVLLAILIITADFLLCSDSSGEDLIEVTASVDKMTALVGDLINYSITITFDSTILLTPPALASNLGGLNVRDSYAGNEKVLEDGRRRQQIQLKLRSFTTGEYVIPSPTIEYMLPDSTFKTISADRIKIEIKSVLAEGAVADSVDLKPLKGQESLASGKTKLYMILAGVVLVAAAIAIFIYRRRQRESAVEEEYVDPRPAWEIAFTELALLKEKNLPEAGEIKLFYFELSDIVRNFLGRQFGFDAIDMTTEEVAEKLTDLEIDVRVRSAIDEFLKHADLVKFAKHVPPADRPNQDWDGSYHLIDQSRDLVPNRSIVPQPLVSAGVAEGRDKREYSDWDYAPPELRPSESHEEDAQ